MPFIFLLPWVLDYRVLRKKVKQLSISHSRLLNLFLRVISCIIDFHWFHSVIEYSHLIGIFWFFCMMLFIDYESGWNFEELTYSGFWTIDGFIRNLFFNGFHPVFPWLGFFLLGMLISRALLKKRQVQIKMISWGLIAIIF